MLTLSAGVEKHMQREWSGGMYIHNTARCQSAKIKLRKNVTRHLLVIGNIYIQTS